MDVGFHNRPVGAHLAPFGHLHLGGQFGQTLVELLGRFRLSQVGPADEGGVIRYAFQVDPTELAKYQAARIVANYTQNRQVTPISEATHEIDSPHEVRAT
jgi:hypothetical protein